jgi:hypothetical protein
MSQPDDESALVARCLKGDVDALGELYKKYHDSLLKILLSRGVDRTDADDLLADVWADCVPPPPAASTLDAQKIQWDVPIARLAGEDCNLSVGGSRTKAIATQ